MKQVQELLLSELLENFIMFSRTSFKSLNLNDNKREMLSLHLSRIFIFCSPNFSTQMNVS